MGQQITQFESDLLDSTSSTRTGKKPTKRTYRSRFLFSEQSLGVRPRELGRRHSSPLWSGHGQAPSSRAGGEELVGGPRASSVPLLAHQQRGRKRPWSKRCSPRSPRRPHCCRAGAPPKASNTVKSVQWLRLRRLGCACSFAREQARGQCEGWALGKSIAAVDSVLYCPVLQYLHTGLHCPTTTPETLA